MTCRLDGRKAFVTGASRGIGRAIAIAYAEAGADVAISARDDAKLAEVATEIESLGRRAVVVAADVLDGDAVRAAVDAAAFEFSGLDIVVNNAGGNSFSVPLTDMRMSGWRKAFELNVESIIHVLQAAAPHLAASQHASVVNVSSVASLGAVPFMSHYGAAKAAVTSLTQTLAIEWAAQGTRVNALLPGWIETDLTDFLRSSDELESSLIGSVPMARWGTSREIAEPAVFLASDASSFMTGQQLVVDGGLSAKL